MASRTTEKLCSTALVCFANSISIFQGTAGLRLPFPLPVSLSLSLNSSLILNEMQCTSLFHLCSFLFWCALLYRSDSEHHFNTQISSSSDGGLSAFFSRYWRALPPVVQVFLWLCVAVLTFVSPWVRLAVVGFLTFRGFVFVLADNKRESGRRESYEYTRRNINEEKEEEAVVRDRELASIPIVNVSQISASLSAPASKIEHFVRPSVVLTQQSLQETPAAQVFRRKRPNGNQVDNINNFQSKAIEPKPNIHIGTVNGLEELDDLPFSSLRTNESESSLFSEFSFEKENVADVNETTIDNSPKRRVNKRNFNSLSDLVVVEPSKRLSLTPNSHKASLLLLEYPTGSQSKRIGRPVLKRKAATMLTTSEAKLLKEYLEETVEVKHKRIKVELSDKTTIPAPTAAFVAPIYTALNSSEYHPISNSFDTLTTPPITNSAHGPSVGAGLTTSDPPIKAVEVITKPEEHKETTVPTTFDFNNVSAISTTGAPPKAITPKGKPPTPNSSQAAKSIAFGIAFADKTTTFDSNNSSIIPNANVKSNSSVIVEKDLKLSEQTTSGSSGPFSSTSTGGPFTFGATAPITVPSTQQASVGGSFTFGTSVASNTAVPGFEAVSQPFTFGKTATSTSESFSVGSASAQQSSFGGKTAGPTSASPIEFTFGSGTGTSVASNTAGVPSTQPFTFGATALNNSQAPPISNSQFGGSNPFGTSPAFPTIPGGDSAGMFALGTAGGVNKRRTRVNKR